MPVAFEGLVPAAGRDHAAWVVAAMTGRSGVDLVVPDGFPAYARIHHRIHDGRRWADFAPEHLVRGLVPYDAVGTKLEHIDGDGNLDADDVDALIPLLARSTATPSRCHYALWGGWGWVHRGASLVWSSAADAADVRAIEHAHDASMAPVWAFAAACPLAPWWGGRDMILFDGPIDAVSTIGCPRPGHTTLERQCPQWWWPEDRAWFVGTEIDHPWTYVAGPVALIDEVVAAPRWESVRVEPSDRW